MGSAAPALPAASPGTPVPARAPPWLLRGIAAAVLSAAVADLRLRVDRSAPSRAAVAVLSEPSPLDHSLRPPLPSERRSDRFRRWTGAARHYEPLRHLPFTPVLTCEPSLSLLMDRFDWQLVPESAWETVEAAEGTPAVGAMNCAPLDGRPWRSVSHIRDPRTVWAAPHSVPRLLELAERDFDPSHRQRAVVFSGTEMPLSSAFGATDAERFTTVRRLRKYFRIIRFMTKDIPLDPVGIVPMGLCWGYHISLMDAWLMEGRGDKTTVAREYAEFEAVFGNSVRSKTKGMLATRGVWGSWLDRNATIARSLRFRSQGLLHSPSNSSNRAVIRAVLNRGALRAWAETPEGQAAGAELRTLSPRQWWTELPKYRFLLNPLGSGLQTAKSIEALLVLTVPIVVRVGFPAHDDLVRIGFPLVMINRWEDVSREAAERWWRMLSPRLESFRRNCLTVDGYWRMFTAMVQDCY